VELMDDCPYCGWDRAQNAEQEIAHMQRAHPEIVAERLRTAGIHEREVIDLRHGPDLPSVVTIGELQMILIFATRYALEATEDPSTVNKTPVGILVRDRGPGSSMPASWVEFGVGERQFAFWRATMDLYEVGPDGAVGDEPLHRNQFTDDRKEY
jgi:hypothetical protein